MGRPRSQTTHHQRPTKDSPRYRAQMQMLRSQYQIHKIHLIYVEHGAGYCSATVLIDSREKQLSAQIGVNQERYLTTGTGSPNVTRPYKARLCFTVGQQRLASLPT